MLHGQQGAVKTAKIVPEEMTPHNCGSWEFHNRGKKKEGRKEEDGWQIGERRRGGSTTTQITWHCSGWTRVIITMDARCLCQSDKTIQLWPCKILTLCQLLLPVYCRFKLLYLLQTHTKAVPCVALLPKNGILTCRLKEEKKHSWRIEMLRGAELPCCSQTH